MGFMRKYAEDVSYKLGYEGEIDAEILEIANDKIKRVTSALWRERLKPAMVSKGLSQTELYKKAGISPGTLYKLKYGFAKSVNIKTLRKLGDVLGINIDIMARYFNEGD